ncbi:MAG: hypothetical protein GWP04_03300 [Gammaproteobacteria bacterium]|nr:hypothetical protein [Gammaproteobacteria bacterium]
MTREVGYALGCVLEGGETRLPFTIQVATMQDPGLRHVGTETSERRDVINLPGGG